MISKLIKESAFHAIKLAMRLALNCWIYAKVSTYELYLDALEKMLAWDSSLFSTRGNILIDYVLMSKSVFPYISTFKVHDLYSCSPLYSCRSVSR